MNNEKYLNNAQKIIIATILAIVISSLYFLLTTPNSKKQPINKEDTEIVSIGGEFDLIDQNGNKFSSKFLQGKLSLIYFGFTYCPDICPTSLQKISEVMSVMEKYHIDVTPVFITIDPKRDTSSLLKEYLAHFHPKIIGLTGSEDDIKQVAEKFKVYYAIAQGNENKKDYMLDHTSFIYLLDPQGKYLKHFYMNSPPNEIIEFIRINK